MQEADEKDLQDGERLTSDDQYEADMPRIILKTFSEKKREVPRV